MPVAGETRDVRQEQARCADAFEALFRAHQREVFGWIFRIVRNRAAAEDLTIETFWRIYRSLNRYDAGRPFEPWARTIATRTSLEWLRRERPWTELDESCAPLEPGSGPDPGEAAEVRAAVATAFTHLAPKLRAAAALVVLDELPQREAAATLGISVAALKVRVFRALRLLRKELQSRGFTP